MEDAPPNSYKGLLNCLSKDWILVEMDHRVSKEASNCFFEVAKKWIWKLYHAKNLEGIVANTPQFVNIRRQLFARFVPPISLSFGYRHKESGEITVLEDLESTPFMRFPRTEYTKLYEIASVKVISKIISI